MNDNQNASFQTIVMDGELTKSEALKALSDAALAATGALPHALLKCKTREEMQKVMADRDTIMLAYTGAMVRSLMHTGPMFEQVAKNLVDAAKDVANNSQSLKDAIDAINLMSEAVRLSCTLALAFA